MAIPYWTITVSSPSATISNVQTVNVTKGLRVLTDNYSSGRITITGRRPDLLPSLTIGRLVTCVLTNPNSTPASSRTFTGRVADLQINYGTVSSMDTWTLELEDAFAVLGRSKITRTWAAGTSVGKVFQDVCTDTGLSYSDVVAVAYKTISATTVTAESALSVMQSNLNTEQGLLFASGDSLLLYSRGWQQYTFFYNYSDAGGAATRYQQVQFLSMADNYSTYVVITINGGSATVVGTGLYSYQEDTYAANTGAATDIGNYVLGGLAVQTNTPNRMTVLLNDETSDRVMNNLSNSNTGVNITLRGQTYSANVIGFTISSDTQRTLVTFNLAGTSYYNFLVLGNTAGYGTLDYNRLGF